ncbi:MAG: STAS/SEC14 domain-containing protein [Synechococcales bacterium]|nr:STAS/SEC14 domain-containing protein [Synechococcales bacterium]
MLEILSMPVENVVGLRISGKIEASDFDRAIAVVEEKLKLFDRLRVYVEVDNLTGLSLEALIKDLQFTLRHYKDFEREAVVSDRQWLQRLAAVGDRLFPSIDVRHFDVSEKEQALAWVQS